MMAGDIGDDIDLTYIVSFASCLSCHLLFFFIRRYNFLKGLPRRILLGDSINASLKVMVFVVYIWMDASQASLIWAGLAMASFFAIVFTFDRALILKTSTNILDVSARIWFFSKPMMSSTLLEFCNSNLLVFVAAGIHGAIAIGMLRLAQTIMGVANIGIQIVESLMPRKAILAFSSSENINDFRAFIYMESKRVSLLVACLGVIITFASFFIIPAYFGDAYDQVLEISWLYVPLYMVISFKYPLEIGLKLLEKTSEILRANFLGFLINITLGFFLITKFSVHSVVLAILINQLISAIYMSFRFNKSYI